MSYRMPNIVCGDKHKRLFETMYNVRLRMYNEESADQLANELLSMIVASRQQRMFWLHGLKQNTISKRYLDSVHQTLTTLKHHLSML